MHFRNLVELHHWQAERLGPRPALRYRKYGVFRDVPWDEYQQDSLACAAALIEAGIAPDDRVGLWSENRIEWLLADMGIMTAGAVNVPAHCSLPALAVARQLADAGVRWLFVSNSGYLEKIRALQSEMPELKGVVVFDRAPGSYTSSWAGFLQRGRFALPKLAAELQRREDQLGADDLATIMYTSGTTGNPKGVMLTHGNLLSNAEALLHLLPDPSEIVLLSWLPFSHIFGRLCDHYLCLRAGFLMVLANSVDTLPFDLVEVQPTHLHGVPRFFEKMLAAAQTAPTPEDAKRRLKFMFGRRIQWIMSGGAPLPPKICIAYREAGIPLLQGYGLTETAPVLTTNLPDNYRVDSAGLPIPGVELKIAPDGEILARGPNIMKGYWHQPQATSGVIRDGWFHTGDMGRIDADGFLYITGRKKELLVLSNGKKVYPTEVEGALQADPCIEQVVVFGEKKNFLSALIVPNWGMVRQLLAERGEAVNGSDELLANHPAVRKLIRERVDAALANAAHWEQVKEFVIRSQPFGVATGELTVSLKMRREVIFAKHAPELEALYNG
ncbi:MAG TPA: AMP-dependent synthetase/ligase [Gemmataceae bacterium]|nr:AMP-dependent synthetase/ligase [Gemmataceae bacterium]